MKVIGFYILGSLFIHIAATFDQRLLKHLPELPKPGGLLEVLKKPKLPEINFHLSKGGGGIGAGASIGSLGFGFGFGGHYVPPGTRTNLPPKELPDDESYVPDFKPGFPDLTQLVPFPKPPGITSEKESDEMGRPRPTWEEHENDDDDDDPKRGSDEVEYPKPDSHKDDKEGIRPAWEDIGETVESETDSKSENFMNGDLINEGLIQPRLNKRRNKRFIESHVYHVPLLFRSNAKPFQVKVQSNSNNLVKVVSRK